MGHLVFIILHIISVLFGFVFLIVTIPAHLIYGAVVSGRNRDRPTEATHRRCPDCMEQVLKGAIKCRHCGCNLRPIDTSPADRDADFNRKAFFVVLAVVVVLTIIGTN